MHVGTGGTARRLTLTLLLSACSSPLDLPASPMLIAPLAPTDIPSGYMALSQGSPLRPHLQAAADGFSAIYFHPASRGRALSVQLRRTEPEVECARADARESLLRVGLSGADSAEEIVLLFRPAFFPLVQSECVVDGRFVDGKYELEVLAEGGTATRATFWVRGAAPTGPGPGLPTLME